MRIVLQNALLLDHSHALTPGSIYIEGERIRSLAAQTTAQDADLVLDLTGCTILPGYVDTNVPVRAGTDMDIAIQNRLSAGITTVCTSVPLNEDSSPAVAFHPSSTCSTGHLYSVLYDEKDREFQEMLKNARNPSCRRLLISGSASRRLTTAQLQRLCKLGSQAGVNIASNAQTVSVLKKLISCGITELLEIPLYPLPNELLMQMVARGVGLSLSTGCAVMHAAETHDNLLNFLKAGGLMAMCSGYQGKLDPYAMLCHLTGLGLSLQQAVRIMTLNGAMLLGTAVDEGSLLAGKLANLTILQGIPSEDLQPFQHIRHVMLKGQLF